MSEATYEHAMKMPIRHHIRLIDTLLVEIPHERLEEFASGGIHADTVLFALTIEGQAEVAKALIELKNAWERDTIRFLAGKQEEDKR